MFQTKKNILIAVVALLLLSVVLCVFFFQQTPDKKTQLSFAFNTPSKVVEIETIYSDNDSTYYLFLPSCAKLDQIIFKTNDTRLILSGKSYCSGDCIPRLTLGNSYSMKVYQQSDSMFSRLCLLQAQNVPMMDISINENYIERIYQDKSYRGYAKMSLYSHDGKLLYDGSSNHVIIKGRGNSTWWEDKKPFLITLEKPDTLLGMSYGTKWVLLANAMDPSNLRNKIALDFASSLDMQWNPDSRYVDLYINGQYNGLYLLTEKIELSDTRLDLEQQPQYLLLNDVDETIINSGKPSYPSWGDQRIGLMDYRGASTESLGLLESDLKRFISVFDGSDIDDSALANIIDIQSWASKYVTDEVFLNGDVWRRSNYFYCTGTPPFIYYSGPIWDYDLSMTSCEEELFAKSPNVHSVYTLWGHPSFKQQSMSIYEKIARPYLQWLIDRGIDSLSKSIAAAAYSDSVRWNLSTSLNASDGDSLSSVETLKLFFNKRLPLLDKLFLSTDTMQFVTIESSNPDLKGFYSSLLYHPGFTLAEYFSGSHHDSCQWIDSATGRIVTIDSVLSPNCVLHIIPQKTDTVPSNSSKLFKWLFPILLTAFFSLLFLLLIVRETMQGGRTIHPKK